MPRNAHARRTSSSLTCGPLGHQRGQFVGIRDPVARAHRVRDDDVVDARAGGQGDDRHLVAVLDMVGERAAAPVEGIGRMTTDTEQAKPRGHRFLPFRAWGGCVHYDSNAAQILQPHCVTALC